MDQLEKRPTISLVFPVYRDEGTVERVTKKGIAVLDEIASDYEIVIVDDASPDRAGEIADRLASENPRIRVIHHATNRGYGEAVKAGLAAARHEWICQTDGDDEYDVNDLRRLIQLREFYDLIITFRYIKLYSSGRVVISWIYNRLVRFMFNTRYRDISTGLRLVRRSVLEVVELSSTSPFLGAELAIKVMLMGYRVGEVGIQTFPRTFGRGVSVSPANILATVRDLLIIYGDIFSARYQLPPGRSR